jgi:hypothetical protein
MNRPLCLSVLALTTLFLPRAAAAQDLIYEVYAGGINAVTAELAINESGKTRYSIHLTAETKGLLGKLAPWRGTFETKGWRLKGGRLQPETYESSSTWRGEEEIKIFTYDKNGAFRNFQARAGDRNKHPKMPDRELTAGTIDSLTATLNILNKVAQGGKCEGGDDVFDGSRRFKLAFHDEGAETLTGTGLNIFTGLAARCTVEVVPDGGKWHQKPRGWMSIQEQGRQKGSLPTIWLAKLGKNEPAVPVKIRVLTDYGTLFMQLAHYRADGAP